MYNDLRDSWSSSARSSAAARFSSERRTGSSAPLQRSHSEDLAFSEHPRSSLGRGNDTSAGSRETLTALEAAARHRALRRHESSRTQRAWCQLSRMVGMDDVTLQLDNNAVDDAFATTTLVERAISKENSRDVKKDGPQPNAKSDAKAAALLGIVTPSNANESGVNSSTTGAGRNRKRQASRCKFHHIKMLLVFLLVKKIISVILSVISVTLWIMAHVNGALPMLSMYMPPGFLFSIVGSAFLVLIFVTCCVRRKGTSPMKSIGIFFLMMAPLLLPDPLSSVVVFCIALTYSFLRKDVRARTLATMAADFIMLIINASSMIYSSAVFGDLAIHDGNRTSSSAPSGGFQWATSDVELESAHVVLRAICSSISLAIVLADLIRIKIGMSSGHMVNGGVSEVRRWITYEEIVNSNYLDTLDLIVESETNHWTSHVQHFFARTAWTHVAMIIRDPPLSVLKAYGLLKYVREMPEHAHLFVFEAVRPSIRLTPLREYMRYKQDISSYKVIGVRKLHLDRKRGINWPELEQFMLDMSTTNFVVGPLAMVKANYQLNADTVDELASVTAVRSATLPAPYSRHFAAHHGWIMFWI